MCELNKAKTLVLVFGQKVVIKDTIVKPADVGSDSMPLRFLLFDSCYHKSCHNGRGSEELQHAGSELAADHEPCHTQR